MSDDANTILKHQEQLAGKRSNWDQWWQDIAYRVLPSQATFTVQNVEEGQKRTERLFDATAAINCNRFAAIMSDLNTPRTQIWHGLAPEDDDLADDQEVKEYLELLNKRLFSLRYRPQANFASQKDLGYLGIGAFGNSCMFIDEDIGKGPRYKNIHISEVFWDENHQGMIDLLYRRFRMKARNAARRFGEKLPAKILKAANDNPFTEFEFIHCVRPNDDKKIIDPMTRRMAPFASYYVPIEDRSIMEAGFFSSWPYGIGRYNVGPNEIYARSPAMDGWPAILTINEEKKSILRAGQLETEPPVLLQEEGALEAFNMRPGALNWGGVSTDGVALAQPFKTGANIPLGMELMDLERKHIDDSFLVTVFQILADNPQMTATQVLEIVQQKAVLLAPVMGRQQSEDIGPTILREIDICARNNLIPPMPEQLMERGGEFKIEYRSPLARAMRAQDGLAIQRTFEAASTVAGVKPEVLDVIDFEGSIRELAEINGMPAKLIRSKDDVEQIQAGREQQQNLATAVQAAPMIAQTAKTAAEADQIRSRSV